MYLISINIRSIIRAARLLLLLLLRLRLGAGCTLCYLAILKMRLQQLFCCAMPLCNMRPKRTLANNMLLKSCHGNSSSGSSRSSCRRTASILFCSVFLAAASAAAAHIIKTKPKAARQKLTESLSPRPCPVLSCPHSRVSRQSLFVCALLACHVYLLTNFFHVASLA